MSFTPFVNIINSPYEGGVFELPFSYCNLGASSGDALSIYKERLNNRLVLKKKILNSTSYDGDIFVNYCSDPFTNVSDTAYDDGDYFLFNNIQTNKDRSINGIEDLSPNIDFCISNNRCDYKRTSYIYITNGVDCLGDYDVFYTGENAPSLSSFNLHKLDKSDYCSVEINLYPCTCRNVHLFFTYCLDDFHCSYTQNQDHIEYPSYCGILGSQFYLSNSESCVEASGRVLPFCLWYTFYNNWQGEEDTVYYKGQRYVYKNLNIDGNYFYVNLDCSDYETKYCFEIASDPGDDYIQIVNAQFTGSDYFLIDFSVPKSCLLFDYYEGSCYYCGAVNILINSTNKTIYLSKYVNGEIVYGSEVIEPYCYCLVRDNIEGSTFDRYDESSYGYPFFCIIKNGIPAVSFLTVDNNNSSLSVTGSPQQINLDMSLICSFESPVKENLYPGGFYYATVKSDENNIITLGDGTSPILNIELNSSGGSCSNTTDLISSDNSIELLSSENIYGVNVLKGHEEGCLFCAVNLTDINNYTGRNLKVYPSKLVLKTSLNNFIGLFHVKSIRDESIGSYTYPQIAIYFEGEVLPKILLGQTIINSVFLGTKKIKKVCLGTKEISSYE